MASNGAPVHRWSADSEEERELFQREDEEEEEEGEVESEYSSTDEDANYASLPPNDPRMIPSGSSCSTTPTSNETPGDIFSQDSNSFSAEIINQASDFISAPPTRPRPLSPEGLIPATDDIGLPDELFPLSPETSPTNSLSSGTPDTRSADRSPPPLSSSPPSLSSLQEDTSRRGQKETGIRRDEVTGGIAASPDSKISSKNKRMCGECSNCLNTTDCKKCRFCRDMRKYGGIGRLRQKCITRQCLKLSRVLAQEGAMGRVSKVGGALDEASIFSIISESLKANEIKSDEAAPMNDSAEKIQNFYSDVGVATSKKTPPTKPAKKSTTKKQPPKKPPTQKKPKKRPRYKSDSSNESETERGDDFTYRPVTRRTRNNDPWYYMYQPPPKTVEKRQCLGPECLYAARKYSKYCSEECGVELAMRRMKEHLPKAKGKWDLSEDPKASEQNRKKVTELEGEQSKMKERLKELDQQTDLINDHVLRMKEIKSTKQDDELHSDSTELDDLTIYCATCSQPIGLRKALLHMERCFTKLEGMVSFGSIVKNDGIKIFCDKYDKSQGTYCKRLKVLCPLHTKEPKVSPNEICGCPLESDFPAKKRESSLFCHSLKKNCSSHYCWEKLRRAEIDQEKLNLYLKLEELGEQMRLLQWQLSYRKSLMAILLHHTIDHSKEDIACTE